MTQAYLPPITPHWPLRLNAGTTRSAHPHANLGFNLAMQINCEEAAILQRRTHWLEVSGLAGVTPMWLVQTHSNTVITDQNYHLGCTADAAISRNPTLMPVVLTADCVPILIANQSGSEVAAVHAGWQGLYQGIIAHTITCLNTPPAALFAWIGPCIRQRHYEVDEAFYHKFSQLDDRLQAYFNIGRAGHWFADLAGIAQQQLCHSGITAQRIYDSEICTFADKQLFSYRRDGALSGRIASFILPKAV